MSAACLCFFLDGSKGRSGCCQLMSADVVVIGDEILQVRNRGAGACGATLSQSMARLIKVQRCPTLSRLRKFESSVSEIFYGLDRMPAAACAWPITIADFRLRIYKTYLPNFPIRNPKSTIAQIASSIARQTSSRPLPVVAEYEMTRSISRAFRARSRFDRNSLFESLSDFVATMTRGFA